MAAKKAKTKGKRYSDEEKAEILKFVEERGRGGGIAAAKKYGVSPLSISKWKQTPEVKTSPTLPKEKGGIETDEVLRILAQKGFKVVRMMNVLTGEILEDKIDPKIEKLNLDFGGIKRKADDEKTYVTQTNGQILVTMTLDRLLSISGTKA